MASLESIRHSPHRDEVVGNQVIWTELKGRKKIEGLPQIMWADQKPWREANLWALSRASNQKMSLKTIVSSMKHIHAYAKWLEEVNLGWCHFPDKEADRCLIRYRGDLIALRDSGHIAPSTAQQRMAAVIRFYRWLKATGLISPDWPMWQEKQVGIKIQDTFGFERTLIKDSTDLAIQNRKIVGDGLEDGLMPIANHYIPQIFEFAEMHASKELALMLHLGFGTGLRIGTICDLRKLTIERAVPDPSLPGYYLIAVGPGAHPPVHTKKGVTGQIWISSHYLHTLKDYMYSVRRLKRQAIADEEHRDRLFLNRFGKPYATEGSDSSRSVNIELGRLRKAGLAAGISAFREFHFHQSRCTFATELARVALKHGGVSMAINLVKCQLLHKHESTTLKYIRFIEKSAVMEHVSNEFTLSFLGLLPPKEVDNA